MASGDVVNTTARLQSAAPVNGILVGETTYRATRHVIDYRDAEPVEAKGKTEPVFSKFCVGGGDAVVHSSPNAPHGFGGAWRPYLIDQIR